MSEMNCPAAQPAVTGRTVPVPAQTITPLSIRTYRRLKRESQERFWGRFGVTQSRGSRFELGMAMPTPVLILLQLYWKGVVSEGDLWRARLRPSSQAHSGALRDDQPQAHGFDGSRPA